MILPARLYGIKLPQKILRHVTMQHFDVYFDKIW